MALPDGMVAYATYELSQKLIQLTAQQRAAIDVIVARHYIGGESLASLFRGDNKICSENTYYNSKRGWNHNPQFKEALTEAARLALQNQETDRQRKLIAASDLAIDNASLAVKAWVDVASFSLLDAKASNDAAQKIIDLAFKGRDASQASEANRASEESDWWAAVDDD